MEINPLSNDLVSALSVKDKQLTGSTNNNVDINSKNEFNQQVEIDDSPATEQWKYFESTDEMAAALTQFSSRRSIDSKKIDNDIFSSFDAILEDDAIGKSDKILSAARGKGAHFEHLLSFAKQMFPDVSDLVLVLREMIKNQALDDVEKKEISKVLEQIEEENADKIIKSGINCSLKAKFFGKKCGITPKFLRAAYRSFIADDKESNEVYEFWISNFGIDNRIKVLTFIQDALICDMSANDPSCSKEEFGSLLNKMNEIHKIAAIENIFIKEIYRNKFVSEQFTNEEPWLYFILSILKHPESIDNVMAELFGQISLAMNRKQIAILLNIIYRAIKKLTTSLFKDMEAYEYLLNYLHEMIGKNYSKE